MSAKASNPLWLNIVVFVITTACVSLMLTLAWGCTMHVFGTYYMKGDASDLAVNKQDVGGVATTQPIGGVYEFGHLGQR